MNEELKKIINYVIDNGHKRLAWDEYGMDTLTWVIRNGNYQLYLDIDYTTSGDTLCYLTFFDGDYAKAQLEITDDLEEFDYDSRDYLIDLVHNFLNQVYKDNE